MARGVGNLNVSVSANTARAIKNLRDFQTEARQTGQTAREMKASFTGNTLADYEARFGGATKATKAGATATRDAAEGMNTFRSAVVDLRKDTDRYSGDLKKATTLTKGLATAMKGLKSIGKILIPITVAISGFAFGKKIGDELFMGEGSFGERMSGWFERTFDPRLAEAKERRREATARGNQQRAEEAQQQKEAAAAAKKQRDDAFAAAKEENRIRMIAAQQGEEAAQFERDKNEHGEDRARILADQRARLKEHEETMASIRATAEAKAEAQRREQLANERRYQERLKQQQDNQRRDAEQLAELRERLRTFGMSSEQKERDRILGGIHDSRARGEAGAMLARLDRLERMQAVVDKNRQTLAGRRDPDALDARTAEGWAALRKNLGANDPAQQMVKKQQEQIDQQIRTNELLAEANRNQPQVFNPS